MANDLLVHLIDATSKVANRAARRQLPMPRLVPADNYQPRTLGP
jgi:hypothetical protein